MSDLPGDVLEADTVVSHRYRVYGYRGDRGFGQLYEAEDTAMGGRVSLMRLGREFSHPRVRESFFETRATAQVEDPRVVDLIDYGEDFDGRLFLAMPWIEDARGLDQIASRESPVSWTRIQAIVVQVAKALEAAHDKGVFHGGLGLSRVLVDSDDGVHVVDFGLAPALTQPGGRPVTNTSPLPGHTAYLSPEQVRGEAVDPRCDIYALGVMLWELIAGAPPFVGDPVEVANAHLEQGLPELVRRGAPAEIEALLHLALAKDPGERLATAGEFSVLLEAMPSAAKAPPRPSSTPAPKRPVELAPQPPNVSRTPTERIASSQARGEGPANTGAKLPPGYPTSTGAPRGEPNRESGPRQATAPLAPDELGQALFEVRVGDLDRVADEGGRARDQLP
ncbi:serine/threonine protein kinase, partial [Enhygromyxa salina]|uniref:serine/threonine protein kinase n=1 Tax=Enhygromyxa salina TaxID=215803 RepID=UPI0015E59E35